MPEEDQNQLEATQALAMLLRELAVGERATVGEAAAVEAVIEAWNKLPTSLRPADPKRPLSCEWGSNWLRSWRTHTHCAIYTVAWGDCCWHVGNGKRQLCIWITE